MTLDLSDYFVLRAIVQAPHTCQGRIPLSSISESTGLSPATIKRRIKVLAIHNLIHYEKVNGRHLRFEIVPAAYVELNNVGLI